VFRCVGRLDTLEQGAHFESEGRRYIELEHNLVINLSDVPFLGAIGIGAIARLVVKARNSGRSVSLCCLNEKLRHVFGVTKLDTVVRIYSTEVEATEAIGRTVIPPI
jgi:anti-anti-sigma factor